MKIPINLVTLFALLCQIVIAAPDKTDGAALQERTALLDARVRGAEAIRAIKRLQYAYGHYAEFGLWNDLADLFADKGVGHYPAGNLGKEEIRKLFLQDVGKGRLGLDQGRLYPHIMFQPVVTLAPDGKKANGRFRVLALLGGYGEQAIWAGGIYENEYILENGVWKFTSMVLDYIWTADYKGGWAHIDPNAKGVVAAPFPKIIDEPFHYKNPITGRKPPNYVGD